MLLRNGLMCLINILIFFVTLGAEDFFDFLIGEFVAFAF